MRSKKTNLFVKPNSGFNNGIYTIENFKKLLPSDDNCYIANLQTTNNFLSEYKNEIFGFDVNFDDSNMVVVKNPTSMDFNNGTFVCYDLETTGLFPSYDHITEIGAVKVTLKNGKVVKKERFQTFIKQDKPLKPFISKLTHITDEMLNSQGISEKDALKQFKAFCGDYPMIGHNILRFDSRMLNMKAKEHDLVKGSDLYFNNAQIDTMEISRAMNNRPNHTLHSMAIDANIPYSGSENHRADKDAEDNWEVFYLNCIPRLKKLGITNVLEINNITKNNIYYVSQHHKIRTIIYPNLETKNKLMDLAQKDSLNFNNISKLRSGMIITNNPTCSEIFDSYTNDSKDVFLETIKKYDFISLPPVSFWTNLITTQESSKLLDLSNPNDKILFENRKELIKLCAKCNTIEDRMIALGKSPIFSKLAPTISNLHSMMIKVDYLINPMCDIKKYSNSTKIELKKSNDPALTIKQIQDAYINIIKTAKSAGKLVVIDNEILVPNEKNINKFYEYMKAHPKAPYQKLVKSTGGCHVYKHSESELIKEFSFLKDMDLIEEVILNNPKKLLEKIKEKTSTKEETISSSKSL